MLWYYYDKDGKQGPIEESDLIFLVQSGVIVQGTIIETETGKQGLARDVKGLFKKVEPVTKKMEPQPPKMTKKIEPATKKAVVPPPVSPTQKVYTQDAIDYLDERIDNLELEFNEKLDSITVLQQEIENIHKLQARICECIEDLNRRLTLTERIINIITSSEEEEPVYQPPRTSTVHRKPVHQAPTPIAQENNTPKKSKGLLGTIAGVGLGLALGTDLFE